MLISLDFVYVTRSWPY